MGITKIDYSSIAEYVAIENTAQSKCEYEKGKILAMTGGSINHGILCGNAYNELRTAIANKKINCDAFGSEIRIHIQKAESIVYPDSMIICGNIETSDEDTEAVTNPVLIVEVLSKSTESYDRGDKFYKYRQLPSFLEYVLVSQDKPVVETFYRKDNNVWEIARYTGLDTIIKLKCLDLKIDMKNL